MVPHPVRKGEWRAAALGIAALLLAASGPARGADRPKSPAAAPKAQPFAVEASKPNIVPFAPTPAKFVRFAIHASAQGQPCIDELEVYGPDGQRNLALAKNGAKPSASSCLPGYPIHQIAHLNEGLYGNSHSWIAASAGEEWAQIELPEAAEVAKVVFSRDREGKYADRLPVHFEIRLSLDGKQWKTVAEVKAVQLAQARRSGSAAAKVPLPEPFTPDGLVRYAFLCERVTWEAMPRDDHLSPFRVDRPALPGGEPYWGALARLDSVSRVLRQMGDLVERLAAKGLDVAAERAELAKLRGRQTALTAVVEPDEEAEQELYLDARLAKRRLFFRDPDLAPLETVLFVRRHPYTPSHNYSDILDSAFRKGGGVCVLRIPRRGGRLEPAEGQVTTLFDSSNGIARDAMADFEAKQIYFAYRPSDKGAANAYWHVMAMNADGGALRQLTDGPFHDYYPCPLPDGGLAFISTRCRSRYLCWRPQAFVLFRMDADGANITPLSHANLSEWGTSVMSDGRILWTRSEYLDKGADFGHTLWAIHPDGSHPALLFGNNTLNCYMNGHQVPGTAELACTLISHGGDLNGPVGLLDTRKGPFSPDAITNITPDSRPRYHMDWASVECFRDPVPISRDHILASHAPADRFGLYVLDRYGNREVLHFEPGMGSMCPTPLRPVARPPVIAHGDAPPAGEETGTFTVTDVYRGLEPAVKRGTVRYLRISQELRSGLEQLASGEYRKDHEPFQDFYASPTHIVRGPHGWPTYVAKASLGLVPVEDDGSASFTAPAGKVLYFQALDAELNEVQRMRSVIQLQPGEKRSCVGCHESRQTAPPVRLAKALAREPSRIEPPPWGAVPFSYEAVVQPVWNAKCTSCHNANVVRLAEADHLPPRRGGLQQDMSKLDLTATLDKDRIPASYRTLISKGWVHYFDYTWGQEHRKAQPLTFGTVQSKLWKVLDAGHYGVKLSRDEMHRVKCWTDLNCPLWPDYQFRPSRPGPKPELTKMP